MADAQFGNSSQLTVLRAKMSPPRDSLLFLRASGAPRTLLYPALTAPDRPYDLAVSYYGDPAEDQQILAAADYVFTGGLSKFHAVKLAVEALPSLSNYAGYFFPDADLVFSESSINGFVRFCLGNNIDLAQPSLTVDSFHSWRITLNHPSFLWRDTNFVEIMAPYLSKRALSILVPTFGESISGWGLDMVWAKLLAGAKVGIADCFSMRHTRSIDTENGPFYRYLTGLGISPAAEAESLLAKYGVSGFRPRTTAIIQGD